LSSKPTGNNPSLGGPAQGVINEQIVDDADILIATFWTRLGTPTAAADSGTLEEIDRFRAAGRPVFVYFCNQPVAPLDSDTTGVERVKAYREKLKTEGLFSEYVTEDELRRKVRDDLSKYLHDNPDEDSPEGGVETPPDNRGAGAGGAALGRELAELRRSFNGWVIRWEATLGSLLDDYNLDNRYALARQIQEVVLETLRLAATIDPGFSLQQELSMIASQAAQVSQIRVYMDGGRSLNALTEGCRELVGRSRSVADREWLPSVNGVT
jgi:hypothetical protein